jgi:AcrR family transcriptional regulator
MTEDMTRVTLPPAKRPDRRRERTQRQLGDALLVLIPERNYDAIRIEDICHRADLGRATFYLHYNSKDELLFAVLKRILQQDHADGLRQVGECDYRALAKSVFDHAVRYRDLYRSLSQSVDAGVIDRQVRSYLQGITDIQLRQSFAAQDITLDEYNFNFLTAYVGSALHGIVMWAVNLEGQLDVELLTSQYYAYTHAGFTEYVKQFISR